MKLWVQRHGYAGPTSKDPKKERDRSLQPEGIKIVTAIANAMGDLDEIPKVIFSSPFQRAIETADIVGKILGVQVNVIGDLSPMRPLEDMILGLVAHHEQKRIMLVGHKDNTGPAMNQLGGNDEWEDLVKGEVRRVRFDRDDGSWKLKWALKPSDLGLKDYK